MYYKHDKTRTLCTGKYKHMPYVYNDDYNDDYDSGSCSRVCVCEVFFAHMHTTTPQQFNLITQTQKQHTMH